ncbi:MAG: hypothetical protein H6727_00085 [Myxococcales bacterium]|nr:hypothetical protein [Myxococcales bacterium]
MMHHQKQEEPRKSPKPPRFFPLSLWKKMLLGLGTLALFSCQQEPSLHHLPSIAIARPIHQLPRIHQRILLRRKGWFTPETARACPLPPRTLSSTCEQKRHDFAAQRVFLIDAHAKTTLRDLLALFSLLPQRRSTRIALHLCLKSEPRDKCQPAWLPFVFFERQDTWLKQLGTPSPFSRTTPCTRCKGSIRRTLAQIRLPPYPLPPHPHPARLVFFTNAKGMNVWTDGHGVSEGCMLWSSLLIGHPIFPTIPTLTRRRDLMALPQCLSHLRKRYPNERRLLLLAPAKTSLRKLMQDYEEILLAMPKPAFDVVALGIQETPPRHRIAPNRRVQRPVASRPSAQRSPKPPTSQRYIKPSPTTQRSSSSPTSRRVRGLPTTQRAPTSRPSSHPTLRAKSSSQKP